MSGGNSKVQLIVGGSHFDCSLKRFFLEKSSGQEIIFRKQIFEKNHRFLYSVKRLHQQLPEWKVHRLEDAPEFFRLGWNILKLISILLQGRETSSLIFQLNMIIFEAYKKSKQFSIRIQKFLNTFEKKTSNLPDERQWRRRQSRSLVWLFRLRWTWKTSFEKIRELRNLVIS